MHAPLHEQLVFAVYGLSFFSMGLAVALRVRGCPPSGLRARLLAFAAFGFFHALFEWIAFFKLVNGGPAAPETISLGVAALSFLPLMALAFLDARRGGWIAAGVCAIVAAVWGLVALSVTDAGALEAFTRYGIGAPAVLIAAWSLTRDRSLRMERLGARVALGLGVFSLVGFGVAQIVTSPAAFFPAVVINTESFQSAFGVSVVLVRAVLSVFIGVSVLALLDAFDELLRRSLEERADDAHAALRAREAQLAQAQRIVHMGSWDWNVVTGETSWSDELFAILGLDRERDTASYNAFYERVHPEDHSGVEIALRNALMTRSPYDFQLRIVRPDGETRVLRSLGDVSTDAHGRAVSITGVLQDVTDTCETQNALVRTQATLASFLEIAPEAVIVTDAEGRITIFSAGAEATFGHAADDMIGQAVERLMPERFREAHRHHIRSFGKHGGHGRVNSDRVLVGLRKNGEEFPFQASLSRLETPHGVFCAAILHDMSEQMAASRELVDAKERAEAADRMRAKVLAAVVREIRAPLTMLSESSTHLLETSLDAEQRRHVEATRRAGERLLALARGLRELAAFEPAARPADHQSAQPPASAPSADESSKPKLLRASF